MSKGKKTELQVTVHSQDQWNELLQKDGLIVVDAYAAWCGPCKAIVSTLKRIKNELGDDLLHFATAETDNIDSLSLYKGKSQPTFLFYSSGVLVHVIRGCNCPVMIKTITSQLEKEHKVLEGKAERTEYIDVVVGAKRGMEKDQDEKVDDKEDEEIAAKMTESMLRLKIKISIRDLEEFIDTEVSKEVSLAIIKPDAVKAGLVDEIVAKVKSEGMEILRQEERTLTKEEAAEFYRQHEASEHFEELVEFMSSGPCMTLIISKGETGEGVIPQFRDLIGPKDVNKAKEEAPNSIRAVYGTSSVMNAIHACDTSESAARELAFFFPDFVSPTVTTKRASRPSSHRTLALIRPDALRHHKDSILNKVKEAGFSIAMAKELTLTREEAEDFYAEHKGKDFFEPLVQNMCSGPVMALCLAREDAVEGWRNLIGPKEVDVAKVEAPESLRAQFHVDESDVNPLHGSDSHSAARREIEKIFPVETTVALIKPETADESGDEIVDRIKEAGFRIISRKDVGLTKELASQFYHEHEGKDFFNGLTDYMSSGQSTVLLLEREDAVAGWRTLMGPTDPEEAREKAPDSIRAVFGKDICKNAVHGSTNTDKAGRIIGELFPEVELLPNGRAIVTPQLKSETVSHEQDGADQTEMSLQEGEMQDKEDTMCDVGITEDTSGDHVQGEELVRSSNDVKDGEPGEQIDGNNQDSVRDQSITIDGDTNGGYTDGRSSADDGSATAAGDGVTNGDDVPKEIVEGNETGNEGGTNSDDDIATNSRDNNPTTTTDATTANASEDIPTTINDNTTAIIGSGGTELTEKIPKEGTSNQNNGIDGKDTNGVLEDESHVVDTTAVPDEGVPDDTAKDDTGVDKE